MRLATAVQLLALTGSRSGLVNSFSSFAFDGNNNNKVGTSIEETGKDEMPNTVPPLPFGADKADEKTKDNFNPLVRPISFTSDKEDRTSESDIKEKEDIFSSAKISPPSKKIKDATSREMRSDTKAVEAAETSPAITPSSAPSKTTANGMSGPNPSTPPPNKKDNKELKLGDDSTVTERMLKKVPTENQTGGAGGASTLQAFQRAEANWARLKAFEPFEYDKKLLRWTQDGRGPPPQFVATDGAFGNPKCWEKLKNSIEKELDFDVVVCGGTLGIFFAMYLQLQGHNVCVVEAGKLRGREQEWNISMDELLELKDLGILTQEDIDAVITTEFPACRSGFKNKEVTPLKGGYFENGIGYECLTPDVLNLGVAPAILLERVSKRFQSIGGVIKEQTRLSGVCVSELVGSAIDLGEDQEPITAKLVLDCMGNASPISAQQRYGKKADGICCVVGSCAGGYDAKTNLYGDIIYTNQPIVTKLDKGSGQYFWEAFPRRHWSREGAWNQRRENHVQYVFIFSSTITSLVAASQTSYFLHPSQCSHTWMPMPRDRRC